MSDWRVAKSNNRALPCHPTVLVRVKVLEPGVQTRWCGRCEEWRYFNLYPAPKVEGILKLHWMTDSEIDQYIMAMDDEMRFDLGG